MHILYITERTTTHDARFITAFQNAGHSVSLAPMHVGAGRFPGQALSDWRSLSRRARGADVIHAGPLTSAAFLAARMGLRPLVGASYAYDVLEEARVSPTALRRVTVALRGLSALVVDSRVVEDAVRRLGYTGQVTRFPWGIDLEKFKPARGAMSGSTVISTRAWEPMYQVGLLVEAFAGLPPSSTLRLLNDGSERSNVLARIAEHALQGRVSLGGYVEESAIASELRAADVYVSAARTDGSSISLLQALGCGLPVVAAAVPGNEEWLRGSAGARLVDPDDTRGWTAALRWALLLSADQREEIRVHHRAIAEARADWTVHARTLVSAYEAAASSSLGRG